MHITKGKTLAQSISDRTDYGLNPKKTNGGELTSTYACDPPMLHLWQSASVPDLRFCPCSRATCCRQNLHAWDIAPRITDALKQHFLAALSELLTDFTALLENCRLLRKELLNFSEIEEKQYTISQELAIVAEMIRKQITENAAREQSQTAYTAQYDFLAERYEALQTRYDTLQRQKEHRQIQADAISGCLFALGELDLLQIQFSEELWNATVERVTVYADGRLVFRFKNGVEVEAGM